MPSILHDCTREKTKKEENKPVAHSSILVTDSDLGITPYSDPSPNVPMPFRTSPTKTSSL